MTPGERIASWRRIRGWSVRKLATAIGMQFSALSRIEHGKQHARAADVEKIAGALGLSMAEFYGLTDPALDPRAIAG